MSRNLLQLVLRHADGLAAEASDAHLLRQFVATRDDAAFAGLVRRHGPMVWAVCRQSVPNATDAEDAFQATFLALAQSAKKIRTPERLAGWLHAAAVRVAAKAKRGFTRRTKHEQSTAKPESDNPVSAAAWNDLLATVHTEVAHLPRSLREAFVLCDLQGVEPAAAATRLGLKGNTLTGQLARARQRLLAALAKRGIGAGAVALGTAVTMPEVLANKVTGGAVPSAMVVELAREVTTMTLGKLKLLAAGLLVAGGLTLSGVGLLSKAGGQPPTSGGGLGGPSGLGGLPPGGPGELPPQPGGPPPGLGGVGGGSSDVSGYGRGSGLPTRQVQPPYLFVGKPGTVAQVAELLRDKGAKGWEYTGPLDVDPAAPPKGNEFEGISKDTRVVLVFKRKPVPMGGGATGGGMMGGLMPGSGGGFPGGMSGPSPFSEPKAPRPDARPSAVDRPLPLGEGKGASTPPKPGELNTEVFKLKYITAEDAASSLNFLGKKLTQGGGQVVVTAEPITNQLLISAPPEVLPRLLEVVRTLDEAARKALDEKK